MADSILRVSGTKRAASQARWLREISRLLVPVRCVGCGAYDVAWCRNCLRLWNPSGVRCEQAIPRLQRSDLPPFPVWALTRYEGAGRMAVLAAKAGGRRDVHATMARLLAHAAWSRRDELVLNPRRVAIVPVASTAKSVRERGVDFTALLAKQVARSCGWPMRRVLRTRRGKRDQVGLGKSDRLRNMAGAIGLARGNGLVGVTQVILVDDIATSGATLHYSRTVLRDAGICVVAGFVLAVTPPPGKSRSWSLHEGL